LKSSFPLLLHNSSDGLLSVYELTIIMALLVELGVQRCIIHKEV
jgi:hypothetical protein